MVLSIIECDFLCSIIYKAAHFVGTISSAHQIRIKWKSSASFNARLKKNGCLAITSFDISMRRFEVDRWLLALAMPLLFAFVVIRWIKICWLVWHVISLAMCFIACLYQRVYIGGAYATSEYTFSIIWYVFRVKRCAHRSCGAFSLIVVTTRKPSTCVCECAQPFTWNGAQDVYGTIHNEGVKIYTDQITGATLSKAAELNESNTLKAKHKTA